MRYLIIDTWNGEGYSDSGIIEDVRFEDMSESNARNNALDLSRKFFSDRYLPSIGEVKVTREADSLFMDNGTDQGAIHTVRVDEDHYGLVIQPNLNEVVMLDMNGFIEYYEGMLNSIEGDRPERLAFIADMFDIGNAGAHTDLGYQILYKL